jgi:hypothetical protein
MLPYLYTSKARYLARHAGAVSAACFRLAALVVVLNKGVIAFFQHFSQGDQRTVLRQWLGIARQVWTIR